MATRDEFRTLMAVPKWHDGLYLFLQNVFHLYPEDRFHALIKDVVSRQATDEAIYREVQAKLGTVKPFLAPLRYALPALAVQKREMTKQTVELLGATKKIDGYMEIGSPGRYISALRKVIDVRGDVILVNEKEPGFSPDDVVERGGLKKIGRFLPLGTYEPFSAKDVPDASLDLVTCLIGLHHADPVVLPAYVKSIHRVLRPGGSFILRDHDAEEQDMRMFASLVHTVFNLGLGVPWEVNAAEPRHFRGVPHWVGLLKQHGFDDQGGRLLQAGDPSLNVLMRFVKRGA